MSDIVIVSLITIVPSTISALAGVYNMAIIRSHGKLITKQSEDMKNLEKNTNSIKDALVEVTGKEAFSRGLKQGQEEKR